MTHWDDGERAAEPEAPQPDEGPPAGPQRLVLVRHCDEVLGLPPFPRLTHIHAWQESEGERPLTVRGAKRAVDLAARLAELEPDALLVSPMRRAVETAVPLVARTGLAPEILVELSEISFGFIAGFVPRTTSGWRKAVTRLRLPRMIWPPLMRGLWLMGWTRGVFGPEGARTRALQLQETLERRFAGQTTVVVAHGVVLLYLHAALLGDTRMTAFKREHRLETGEYRILDLEDGVWAESGSGRARP